MYLRVRHVQLEAPSEWILIGKILARKNLVDQRHLRRRARVLPGEETAANEFDLHGLEIISTDHVDNAVWFLTLRGRWLSVDDERRKVCAFKWKPIRYGHRLSPWQCFDQRL